MIMENVKKILLSFIISILMFNFICSDVVNATSTTNTEANTNVNSNTSTNTNTNENTNTNTNTNSSDSQETKSEKALAEKLSPTSVVDGIVGIFTIFERLKIVILGGVFQYLGTIVGESAGTTYNANVLTVITPADILFNKLAITDINFFDISTFGTGSEKKSLTDNNPIKVLKQNIANWYMTLRTTALIILSAILIYIGIRMVLSTSAENKSNYKKMFMNWVVSLAMVFLLHYLIILVINVNNALVEIISSSLQNKNGSDWYGKFMIQLATNGVVTASAVYGWSCSIIYLCIVALTFVFLIMYIKRMIVIAFLILISPLITITYSIDKVGDGQAQAFSNWIKEFMQNVLIQPFHCLIYVAFVSVTMNLLNNTTSLAAAVLTVITMLFILQSESIIKKIFNITSDTTGNSAATAAVLGAAYSKLSVGGNRAKVATNGAKNANVASKVKPQASSNVAQKNIEASSEAGNKANSVTTAKNPTNFSQELSARMNSPQALTADYNRTMDNNDKEEKFIDAQAEDYDNLMGNSTGHSKNINTASALADSKSETGTPKVSNVSNNAGTESNSNGETKNNDESKNEKNWKYYAKKGLRYTGKGIKMADSLGIAGMALSGTLAGVAGKNIAETGAAMAVGRKMQKNTEAYAKDTFEEKKEYMEGKILEAKQKYNKYKLENDFQNYKNGAKVNRNADIQSARNYLAMNSKQIEKIKSEPERQYVQSLHAMRNLYDKDGIEGDSAERVIQSMENIIDKNEPKADQKKINKSEEKPKE